MKMIAQALKLLISDPSRLVRKMKVEFAAPSMSTTAFLRRIYCRIVPPKPKASGGNAERLLFVYDTLRSPVTYDFLHYLSYANYLVRKLNRNHVDVILVTRDNALDSREKNYIAAVGDDNIAWRITNLAVPLCRLFPAVDRICIGSEAMAFELVKNYDVVQPHGYSYESPKNGVTRLDTPGWHFVDALLVPTSALQIIESYFPKNDPRHIVTITLRNYDYLPVRNSNIDSWVAFAARLDRAKFRVVFIPDASARGVSTMQSLRGCEVFDSACWNLELRAALYSRAWMNMGVACGPLAISGLMAGVVTVMIDRSLDYPKDYLDGLLKNGLVPGQAPAFYSTDCHFHLGIDDERTLLEAFRQYAR